MSEGGASPPARDLPGTWPRRPAVEGADRASVVPALFRTSAETQTRIQAQSHPPVHIGSFCAGCLHPLLSCASEGLPAFPDVSLSGLLSFLAFPLCPEVSLQGDAVPASLPRTTLAFTSPVASSSPTESSVLWRPNS